MIVVREKRSGARAAVLGAVAATLLAARAGGKVERAHRARADAAEGLSTTTATTMLCMHQLNTFACNMFSSKSFTSRGQYSSLNTASPRITR